MAPQASDALIKAAPYLSCKFTHCRWRKTTTPCIYSTIATMRRDFLREGRPATLGSTARADVLLRFWCRDCRHEIDADPGEQAARYGADLPVPDWATRLVCS